MGNEQQGGTSHHFVHDSEIDENQQLKRSSIVWTKNGRIPMSKQHPTAVKSSWQLARDASMDMLSRKTTRLTIKQGQTPNLGGNRKSVLRKYSLHPTPGIGKPLVTYRVPRIPTEKQVADILIAHQLLCEFCDGPCIGDYVRCRVCIKTYHSQCLYERGHVSEKSFSLPRLGKQDWSCPDCGDLTRLLNQEEINYLISVFDQIDRNKDGYIIMDEFLAFCASGKMTDSHNLFTNDDQELEKTHFTLMDIKQKGAVAWSDFALFYSCKLIAAKNKTELTTKLSTKELVFAKNLFLKDPHLKFDKESNIIITKDHFNRVIYDMMLLIKKKYGGDFVDAVLHENQHIDERIENLSVMGWDEFLRQLSVPIILNRINYDLKTSQPRRASIPNNLLKATVVAHINLTSSTTDVTKNLTATPVVTISPDLSIDDTFRKHGKLLEKLNQRDQQEELKRKLAGSVIDWTVMEDVGEEENFELPKLKPNARDERQTISEPWSVVKDMQQLRNQPILVTTTRFQMLKV